MFLAQHINTIGKIENEFFLLLTWTYTINIQGILCCVRSVILYAFFLQHSASSAVSYGQ